MHLSIRRLAIAISAILTLSLWGWAARAQENANGGYNVVFQLTAERPEQWTGMLGNIDNIRKAMGGDLKQVEVVAYGKGIGIVLRTNTALAARMEALSKQNVQFVACENTMRRLGVTKADLLPFVGTVDSGVAQIVRRQKQGWQHIHVGQ